MAFSIIPGSVEEARIMAIGRGLALGELAEHLYGAVEMPESMDGEVKVFCRAFLNWFRLVHLVGSGQGYLLDKTQRQAHHMLLDWWSGVYCDPKPCIYFLLCKLAPIMSKIDLLNDEERLRWLYDEKYGNITYIDCVKADLCLELSEQGEFSSHAAVGQLETCVSHFLEFLNHRYDTVTRTVTDLRREHFAEESVHPDDISAYDWTMWHMFQSQFCGVKANEPPAEWHIADGQRYYRDTEFLVLKNRERGRDTRIEEHEDEADDGTGPTYLLRPLESDRLVPKTTADFMEICLSDAANFEWPEIQRRNLLAANIMPYVDNGPESFRNYPQYLWNRTRATLEKTSALVCGDGPPPDYMAISHLGRRQEIGQSHIFPGGWKYPVPSMDKFKIGQLAGDLQQLEGVIDTEYVWMDLLCLPQCEEDDEQDPDGRDYQLKLLELSRQTAIFQTAVGVVKWPHESLDLSSLMGKIMVRVN
ncbi:hypothetical protein ACQKWADRAFT_205806 [Trichoderma austrokoningii]